MKYASLAFKNLFRSKRRTLLTISSIAVSLFIFAALMSVPSVANQLLADTASSVRIVCRSKAGLNYPLPEAYRSRIIEIPHVTAVVGEIWFGGIYHEVTDQFPNVAMDPGELDTVFSDWGFSKKTMADFKRIRTACILAPSTMSRFGLHVGDQIMLRGTIFPVNVTLTIVGTVSGAAPPNFLIFRRDYLEELLGRPGRVDVFWARVDRSDSVAATVAALDREFANSAAETRSESESAFFGGILRGVRAIFAVAELLAFIVVVTIGMVAANTAAMSIRERQGEIAVMRSLGFPTGRIMELLLAESVTIGAMGGLLGCAAAYVVLRVIAVGSPAIAFGALRIPPSILIETPLVGATIGLVSAYIPVRAATRRNIVDALRMAT